MHVAHEEQMISYDAESGILEKTEDPHGLMKGQFKKDLLHSYIDSYLMAILALSVLLDIGANVDQKRMSEELHHSIKTMYHGGHIRFLNSCWIEVLDTAFGRFAELGLCEKHVYSSQYS